MFFKKKKKIKIIPLGQNCIPRTILTRWGIKPSKLQGELTYPFDLTVIGVQEVTKSLRTNFEEFFINLNYDEAKQYWIKNPNCIEFVHDKRIKHNEINKLIKTYLRRIKNFINEMENPNPIVFIQILGEDEDVINLHKEITKIRQGKPFELIIIDTQNIVKDLNIENTHVLKIEYPSQEYKNNWWKKEYYRSEAGINFEKKIYEFCKEIIQNI